MIEPDMFPVYFVIVEPVSPGQTRVYQMQVLTILKVVEGDWSDYREVYDTYIVPLVATGRNVFYYTFLREPDNPLKWKNVRDVIKEYMEEERE